MIVHTSDDQCTVGDDGRCSACGATHAAPCPGCGATAYGRPGCDRCSPPPPIAVMLLEADRLDANGYSVGAEVCAKLAQADRLDAVPSIMALDLAGPAAWPVLEPSRGVATTVSRRELLAMPREELERVLARPGTFSNPPSPRAPVAARPYAGPFYFADENAGAAASAKPVVAEVVDSGDRQPIRILQVSPADLEPGRGAVVACRCGYPDRRTIHTGGEWCPPGTPPLDRAARTASVPTAVAGDLDLATVHGFGHPDVTLTSQVSVSSPPPEPGRAGAYVDLRVYVRPRDLRRGRLVAAHLHELAAAVLRATPSAAWPVSIVVAGDCALPSGYVGRIAVELDHASERGPALEVIRSMHELGSRPW